MEKIRNLAISGVDTLEKVQRVCEITGSIMMEENDYKNNHYDSSSAGMLLADIGWANGLIMDFRKPNLKLREHIRLTYEEFLEKYDKPKEDDFSEVKNIIKRVGLDTIDIIGSESESQTISIVEKVTRKEHVFEKPVFPLRVFGILDNKIFGAVFQNDSWHSCHWSLDGECGRKKGWGYSEMNLTPKKPMWYEDESNFPCLITPKNRNGLVHRATGVSKNRDKFTLDCEGHVAPFSEWRLMTKQERDSLYCES